MHRFTVPATRRLLLGVLILTPFFAQANVQAEQAVAMRTQPRPAAELMVGTEPEVLNPPAVHTEMAGSTLKQEARNAGVADAVTTALGLAVGAVEANPLGAVVSVGLKPVMLRYIKDLPEEQQAGAAAMAASMWGGASANNACIAISVLSGGGFGPVCLAAGVAYGWMKWKSTEDERIFWEEGCPGIRAYSGIPELKCVYMPPENSQMFAWLSKLGGGTTATADIDVQAP
jgi:hypothetical protein